jgi:EmrB/QacA subfamily drug resistance transporter
MHHRPHTPSAPLAATGMRWSLLLLLSVAQLMVILDISAVNVALPDLAADLGIDRGDIGWTITSYSLIFGSLLLFGGRAADLLGRRRVFLTGLGVFTASSLVTALAGDATVLFGARAGQGLGAAMLSPAALSIITTSFHGPQRAKALGVWGAVGGAGAAIGVLLGGALTELVDWRAIFFINLPIGAVLAAAAMHLVPADTARPRWQGLDLRGALVATTSLGALVYALSRAETVGWTSTQTLGIGAAAIAGVAAFAALELRTRQPLLRVQRLTDRAIGGGFVMMLAASAVLFGSFLLSSLYLQQVWRSCRSRRRSRSACTPPRT